MAWRVIGLKDDVRQRLPLLGEAVLAESPPSLTAFRGAFEASAQPGAEGQLYETLDHFYPASNGATPGVDAVATWVGLTSAGAAGSGALRAWGDGLALYDDGQVRGAFWHERASFAVSVPEGFDAVEIEYRPSSQERLRRRFLLGELASLPGNVPANAVQTLAEINGVVGTSSFALHDLLPMRLARGVLRVTLNLARLPAKLFGGAITSVGAAMHTQSDGSFEGRVAWEEQRSPEVAQAIPRLSQGFESETAAIVVHGLASCSVPAARALFDKGFHEKIDLYRFEHDTFPPINRNADELLRLIKDTGVGAECLMLICHSRGGLVGRSVAARLLREDEGRNVQVITLGTPHQGTNAANAWWAGAAPHALRTLYHCEATTLGGKPDPDSVARARLPSVYPPPGLEALLPGSEFLLGLRQIERGDGHLHAIGAVFDPARSGRGVARLGAELVSAFGDSLAGEESDLIVPTHSATGVGRGTKLKESCSHFSYFLDDEVHELLGSAVERCCQNTGQAQEQEDSEGERVQEKQAILRERMPRFKL
jgi:hypothetical protein